MSPPNQMRKRQYCSIAHILLLALTLFVQRCSGVKNIMNSPFGVGIQSALNSHHFTATLLQNRRNLPCSHGSITHNACHHGKRITSDDQHQRFSSLYEDDSDTLDATQSANVLRKRQHRTNEQERCTLDSATTLCTAATVVQRNSDISSSFSQDETDVNSSSAVSSNTYTRGGGTSAMPVRELVFWESMISGAISRSVAQTIMHPANTMKTILQSSRRGEASVGSLLTSPNALKTLSRGAGANFVLSVPHGAVNFAVLELVRQRLSLLVESVPFLARRADVIGPGLDFMSSAVSTICCSIVSTPQMMITDNIMAGNYPNLVKASSGLYSARGVKGFYSGWWPGLVGKIPSYALTWTFFQQLKRIRTAVSERPAKNYENAMMGCLASGTAVCIMMPMDTIKTRLVTQLSKSAANPDAYKGIVDCAVRIMREEGFGTFYRGLTPRLFSVVPMIGIQFGVYEFMKKVMLYRTANVPPSKKSTQAAQVATYGIEEAFEEAAMEVAADLEQPFPAPHFLKRTIPKKVKKRVR